MWTIYDVFVAIVIILLTSFIVLSGFVSMTLIANNYRTRRNDKNKHITKVKPMLYKPWVYTLPLIKQSNLLSSLRGCDIEHPILKQITHMFRNDVVNDIPNPNARNKYLSTARYNTHDVAFALKFLGRTISPHWEQHMVSSMKAILNSTDDFFTVKYYLSVLKRYGEFSEYPSYVYRLIYEAMELEDRVSKLEIFIKKENNPLLDEDHIKQLSLMESYLQIVLKRIEDARKNNYEKCNISYKKLKSLELKPLDFTMLDATELNKLAVEIVTGNIEKITSKQSV